MKKYTFIAEGMHCKSCEKIIEREALKIKGVKSCSVDYKTQTCTIECTDKVKLGEVFEKINKKGYDCTIYNPNKKKTKQDKLKNMLGIFFGILGFILVIYFISSISNLFNIPDMSTKLSYTLIFLIGLVTGLHCISMCGGFVVSYTSNDLKNGNKSFFSHLKYGSAKTLSYTIIGAIFGLVGSIIAFTPKLRGTLGILAGIFLIIYGLKTLNVFSSLRSFGLRTPMFVNKFVFNTSTKNSSSPIIIGLLNGLMIACGPLQAMYIMAAGTGSAIEGAKILFIFGLGTLPVLLSFGIITTAIGSKYTRHILKTSAFIIIILGIIMLNNGLTLSGSNLNYNSITSSLKNNILGANSNSNPNSNTNYGDDTQVAIIKDGYQEITMEVNRYGWSPDKFVIQKDIPVKWIINGKEINGCNNAIIVPAYNLDFGVKSGEQIIEFTPNKSGTVSWSCWMGMIPGTFIVVEQLSNTNEVSSQISTINSAPKTTGGSCSMGANGGSCGWGG